MTDSFQRLGARLALARKAHGETLEDTFSGWEAECGAAVTNYESMRKILGKIDNRMRLSLLVVDEAHYIKNPSAQRTP